MPENELTIEINESFQHTVQLEKRASLFTTAWPPNVNHLFMSPLTSFGFWVEGGAITQVDKGCVVGEVVLQSLSQSSWSNFPEPPDNTGR